MADAADLKSAGPSARGGSTPPSGTNRTKSPRVWGIFRFSGLWDLLICSRIGMNWQSLGEDGGEC